MTNESINIYKLIVLYMLSRVKTPLPQKNIIEFVTSRDYTNYFTIQTAFGDLLQAELIREDDDCHQTNYIVTDIGKETLQTFGAPLSPEIRREADLYLKEKKKEIIEETSLASDYHRTKDNTYAATCVLRENSHVLYEVTLDVVTEAEAVNVCANWKKQGETLYQQALLQLLGQ